jgi:hypothetical protein
VRQPSPLIQETGEGIRTVDLAGTTVTTKVDGPATADASSSPRRRSRRAGLSHRLPLQLSKPARATQILDVMEPVFSDGAPDPDTAGPLLAQIDMELLAS